MYLYIMHAYNNNNWKIKILVLYCCANVLYRDILEYKFGFSGRHNFYFGTLDSPMTLSNRKAMHFIFPFLVKCNFHSTSWCRICLILKGKLSFYFLRHHVLLFLSSQLSLLVFLCVFILRETTQRKCPDSCNRNIACCCPVESIEQEVLR